MSRLIILSTLAAVVPTLIAACAAVPAPPQEGTVSAVFVEPLPGILLSPALAEPDPTMPRWVEVRLDASVAGQAPTLARVDARSSLAIGDHVTLEPGAARPAVELPVPGVPGLRAFRTTAADARPMAVASVRSRTFRVEVMPP